MAAGPRASPGLTRLTNIHARHVGTENGGPSAEHVRAGAGRGESQGETLRSARVLEDASTGVLPSLQRAATAGSASPADTIVPDGTAAAEGTGDAQIQVVTRLRRCGQPSRGSERGGIDERHSCRRAFHGCFEHGPASVAGQCTFQSRESSAAALLRAVCSAWAAAPLPLTCPATLPLLLLVLLLLLPAVLPVASACCRCGRRLSEQCKQGRCLPM